MRSTLEKRLEKSAKSLEEQRREKQRKLARWEDNHDDAFDKYQICIADNYDVVDDFDEYQMGFHIIWWSLW